MIINLVKNMRRALEQADARLSHRILLFEAIREIERLQKKDMAADFFGIRKTQPKKISPLSLVKSNSVTERVMP